MEIDPDAETVRKVRQLAETIQRKRMFEGYSGWPRMASGGLTVAAAVVMGSDSFSPGKNPIHHLIGWGVVLTVALLLNYGAVAFWFLRRGEIRRKISSLKPALDAVPALAAGAIMSIALIWHEDFDLLFGTWMLLYGLAQTAYYGKLPAGVYGTGLIYMLCGTLLLLQPQPFTNPWPMASMFFFGEIAGGLSLIQQEKN